MGPRSGLSSWLSNARAAKNPKLRNCPQKFGQENGRDNLGTNKKSTSFRSFREADVVFPRKYCKIIESAEKYQPELLDLGVLTKSILAAKETKDIAITDKDGKPIKGINIIHDYVTNVNEDRIDLKSIKATVDVGWSNTHSTVLMIS